MKVVISHSLKAVVTVIEMNHVSTGREGKGEKPSLQHNFICSNNKYISLCAYFLPIENEIHTFDRYAL